MYDITYTKYLALLALFFTLYSCSSSKAFKKQLVSERATHNYLIENNGYVSKQPLKLFVFQDSVASPTSFPKKTFKQSSMLLPLLFYTYHSSNFSAAYDSAGATESPNKFLIDGFAREAQYKCNYTLTQNPDSADIFLALHLEEIDCAANFKDWTQIYAIPILVYVVVVSNHGNDILGGEATTIVNYKMTNRLGDILNSGSTIGNAPVTNFEKLGIKVPYFKSVSSLNAILVETTSISLSKNFSEIIHEINKVTL